MRGIGERGAGGEPQRKRRDDRVARAGDVRHLECFGRQIRFPIRRQQPHAVLAARDEHALASRPGPHACGGGSGFVCGPDAQVRDRLCLVMVGRDDRRALVVVDVRDLRIDQDRDAAALRFLHARPRDASGDDALQVVGDEHGVGRTRHVRRRLRRPRPLARPSISASRS